MCVGVRESVRVRACEPACGRVRVCVCVLTCLCEGESVCAQAHT